MTNFAWHYTTGYYWAIIKREQLLKPIRTNGAAPNEKSVIWFSTNTFYENTARKGIIKNGKQVTATMEETYKFGNGLIRIGIDEEKLPMNIYDFKRISGIPQKDFEHLIREGYRQQANPDEWRVSFVKIPFTEWSLVQNWDGEKWQKVEMP